ncbi:hypothetical protein GCM10007881_25680 [Mesorhizobium huakuii]|uniref:ArnT family glycosyltransferase n=1 Tax=Mesorhizobium huakuii TaxID=28104 RepID=UPI00235D2971|nr:hypothetical protein [Mesorhizobium huakuii]GLQ79051.1 hypothetical protein GCM10007881_25680 [Mesorhizobium huakuii]
MKTSDNGSLQAVPASAFAPRWPWTPVAVIHLAACLAVVVLTAIAIKLDAYNYIHATASSHFAVIARAFNVNGLFDLGLVPVQNNGPLTNSPDAYLHWPPLYPILLALWFRVFGEGVIVQHLLSVALNVMSAALIWRSFAGPSDKTASGLAVLAFLGAPIMFSFGFAGLHLHLAIMLTLLALVLFARNTGAAARDTSASHRRILLGVGAFAYFLAVMTSWEPLLAAPAFCFLALRDRHRQTTSALVLFGFAAVAALLSIVLLYGTEYPYFAEELWNRALMRSGSNVDLYPPDYTVTYYLQHAVLGRLPSLGVIGMLGLVGGGVCMLTATKLPRPAVAIYLGSLSMFCLWAAFMRNHLAMHEYQLLILLPAAACGAGLLVERFFPHQRTRLAQTAVPDQSRSHRYRRLTCLVAPLLAASSSYAAIRTVSDFTPSNEMIALADLSKSVLPDNAIIVTPYGDMVFVYYSGRHVIRAIESEDVLDREQRAIAALCATCPIYLVANSQAVDAFPSYRLAKPLAEISNTGAIWRLGKAPT